MVEQRCSVKDCVKKVCARGLCRKHYDQWWRKENLEKLREHDRRYYRANRKRAMEKVQRWQQANPGKVRERKRRWYRANRERVLEKNLKWHQANPERAREFKGKWRLANPDKMRENCRRHRARKRQVVSNLTIEEETTILSAGCFFSHLGDCLGNLSLAHNVPLSKGGNTTRANVFCLCRRHNSQMGTKGLAQILEQIPIGLLT